MSIIRDWIAGQKEAVKKNGVSTVKSSFAQVVRFLVLLLLVTFIFIGGLLTFGLGIALSVLLLCYWNHEFTYFWLIGDKKTLIAGIYFLTLLVIQLAFIVLSLWKESGTYWNRQERLNRLFFGLDDNRTGTQALFRLV